MSGNGHPSARQLRSRLTHPVIDADGHWLEYGPIMRDEFRKIGGDALYLSKPVGGGVADTSGHHAL